MKFDTKVVPSSSNDKFIIEIDEAYFVVPIIKLMSDFEVFGGDGGRGWVAQKFPYFL
jgi:hypothetical protein